MKPFSLPPAGRPVSRADAQKSFVVNQFATPGLGSMMARRFVAGSGQLLLALTGFVLVTCWFVMKMLELYSQIEGDAPPQSYAWLGKWGGLVFAAAWLWSLVTSISLFREAKAQEQAAQKNPPPRIDEVAGGTSEK
jgi:NADH:ubiquinone oxidoreductase subunit 6 (subunit J)